MFFFCPSSSRWRKHWPHAICSSAQQSRVKLAKIQSFVELRVLFLWFCLVSFWVCWFFPSWYTIIRQMFYEEKCRTQGYLSPDPYVACKRTTHKQPKWPMGTMCVSVCVPWGPLCVCWVRGGQGFNKGTGLVQGCQSDCLGTCNLMGSRWKPPYWTCSSKPTTSRCTDYLPLFLEPLSGFSLGF